jgi:hypothetical protein
MTKHPTDEQEDQGIQEAIQALAEQDEIDAADPNYVSYPWTPEEQEAHEALAELDMQRC